MTGDDFQEMAAAMAQSLMASDVLAARGPDSPPWVVSIDKVRNLTSDVMTESEQWAIIADLRGSVPLQSLWDQKNVWFVLPPERMLALREMLSKDEFDEAFGSERRPTHTMVATFRSATRAGREGRTDLYYNEFEIIDLHTGRTVWSDRFEYKRRAEGHPWD